MAAIHDQSSGQSDLLIWLNSVGGNAGVTLVQVVRFTNFGQAFVEYSLHQDTGDGNNFESGASLKSINATGVMVVGRSPRQGISVTLPLQTSVDAHSEMVRMYHYSLAFPETVKGSYGPPPFVQTYNDRPFVGIDISWTTTNCGYNNCYSKIYVQSIYPASPSAGRINMGDQILNVAPNEMPVKSVGSAALGPLVIDEVALLHPGQVVTFTILRAGKQIEVPIRLGQWDIRRDVVNAGLLTTF